MFTGPRRRLTALILRILLTLGFLAAAFPKFLPGSGWHARFAAWGYSEQFLLLIGLLEVLAVVGLWFARVAPYAQALLALILCGALYTNLVHPPRIEALRPVLFLMLLTILAFAQRAPVAPTPTTGPG